ncbi:UDP-glucose--hexose-1-phosphate uridylyltransferase [Candidatus Stoquefichus sp. SB1]|uniref:UDP-glucose--hexose-1-phosphate uridylyltransferase n=1 Tax=Candidatus Stoquefichus sp. SB1 TaxID=1658109 RepID=UPI00067F44C7|nr:UDP-glucose--hexose-1-phosphate uridylyltransferase [Candidatus Stoquefichus sp. SB1]
MIQFEINRLIRFGLDHEMIEQEDVDYSVNLLLDLFQLDSFEKQEVHEFLPEATPILEKMLDYAVEKGLIENNMTAKDLFDTRIMNCIMPRPSEVIKKFNELYQQNPELATNHYYQLSIASNYIRKSRTDKNIRFKKFYKYGQYEITINLSKPEKDPQEIAKAKLVKSSGYPQCLLCKENVGFSGDFNRAARQTHRIIPVMLDNSQYYIQYSPYVYYNEHCIVLNKEHQPMVINKETFTHLLTFIEQFPHYMLGSNADLPIVGGSILSHDHFQGGRYTFPIEGAEVIQTMKFAQYPNLRIEIMRWPLSTIRMTSPSKQEMIDFANKTLNCWKNYSNPDLNIISHSGKVSHNTITPIARMKKGEYQMELVLRNNRTTEEYPDGIFHPHQNLHHIKKENIGLIEVMGLAILPARLKDELFLLRECLLGKKNINDYEILQKHRLWYEDIKENNIIKEESIDDLLADELTKKFVCVLEDAGVFKMNEEGIDSFIHFVKSIDEWEEK